MGIKMKNSKKLYVLGLIFILLGFFLYLITFGFGIILTLPLILAGFILIVLNYLFSRTNKKPGRNIKESKLRNEFIKSNENISNSKSKDNNSFDNVIFGDKKTDINEKIKYYKNQEPNLQLDFIRNLVKKNELKKANEKLNELITNYNEFKRLNNKIVNIDDSIESLTEKLANGKLSSEAYTKANENLEQKRKNIEEKIWRLKNSLFKDEYEKPF